MESRKTMWLAIAVVGLLLCGLGMGIVPGSSVLLPLRQVLADYEVEGIVFPMSQASSVYVASPAGVNTTFLPVRAAVNTAAPPARVTFDEGPIFDQDFEIPFIGHFDEINLGVDDSFDIDANAFGPDPGTFVNTVSRSIDVYGLPDDDANGIPENEGGDNDVFAVETGGVWVAQTGTGTVYSAVASVGEDTMGVTEELALMAHVVTGSDVTLAVPNEAVPGTDGRLVVRTAPAADEISAGLDDLLPSSLSGFDVSQIVAIDAHLIDSGGAQVGALAAPIMVHVPVDVTEEITIPIFYAETDLDANYDVDATGAAFQQLPVGTNIVNKELVFPVSDLTMYVPLLHGGAPIINSVEAPAAGPIAGCAPVTISASGYLDEDALTVQIGGSDATDVFVTYDPVALTGEITCVAPPGSALGAADVSITNPDVGGEGFDIFGLLEDAYGYTPSVPANLDIDPDSSRRNRPFTITGEGIEAGAEVFFGEVPVDDVVVSIDCVGEGPTHTITGTIPRGVPRGLATVTVNNPLSGTAAIVLINILGPPTPPPPPAPVVVPAGGGRGGAGGPCFVATATYGTPMADQLEVLRTFRDRYLLTNAAGTALMKTYYKYSPAVANTIADSSALRAVTRVALTPIVALLVMPLWIKLALVSLAVAAAALIRRRVRA